MILLRRIKEYFAYKSRVNRLSREYKLPKSDICFIIALEEGAVYDDIVEHVGNCPECGTPWEIVRPGKYQPCCE